MSFWFISFRGLEERALLFASLERKERNELEADPSFSSIFLLFPLFSIFLRSVTDEIRPDWEAKLAAVKAVAARRANRRIVMRQVSFSFRETRSEPRLFFFSLLLLLPRKLTRLSSFISP